MRRLGIKLGIIALVLMMAIVFSGCGDNGSGIPRVTPRTVTTGVVETIGWGHHRVNPINVTTEFRNNQIVRISIGQNSDSPEFIESVRNNLIPRILYHQVLGMMPTDAVSGATVSSMGVREAVMAAITEAGGNPAQWVEGFPRRTGETASFDTIFDVIVVGLGGSGTMAYLAASDVIGTSVLGLEAAGHIGGMSAHVLGSVQANSENLSPTTTVQNMRNQWVVPNPIPGLARDYFRDRRHMPNTARHASPNHWGGADEGIVDWFVENTGPTLDWLMDDHGFTITSMPFGAVSLGIISPAPASSRSQLFQWRITDASRRNPQSTYATGMRAMSLIPPSAGSPYYTVTVRNQRTGRDFLVMGRTVVLTTGGFLANPVMMQRYFGVSTPMQTIYTQLGDGINMGRDAGAATYNIRMPFVGNQATVLNIVRPPIPLPNPPPAGTTAANWHGGLRWKNTVASMLLTPHSLMVGMETAFNGSNDYVGRRFMPESPGAVGARWWASGGFFASIYCADNITRIRTDGFRTGEPATSFVGQNIGGAFFNPTTGANPTNAWAAGHPIAEIDAIIDWAVASGNAIRAPNLANLAAQLNARSRTTNGVITEARLRETIERYNTLIASGTDSDWGKLAAGGAFGTLMPINVDGPFVVFLGAGYFYGTSGGLDVNVYMNVLDPDHNPIPGLFAAGQDSMGVIFHAYEGYGPSGSANAWAITSGRRAGTQAALAAEAMRTNP